MPEDLLFFDEPEEKPKGRIEHRKKRSSPVIACTATK
jgi:hypothetical protein